MYKCFSLFFFVLFFTRRVFVVFVLVIYICNRTQCNVICVEYGCVCVCSTESKVVSISFVSSLLSRMNSDDCMRFSIEIAVLLSFLFGLFERDSDETSDEKIEK